MVFLVVVGFFVLDDFEMTQGKINQPIINNHMIMNSDDEKFFENLSGAKTEADGEYDVELREGGAAAPAAMRPKMIRVPKRIRKKRGEGRSLGRRRTGRPADGGRLPDAERHRGGIRDRGRGRRTTST